MHFTNTAFLIILPVIAQLHRLPLGWLFGAAALAYGLPDLLNFVPGAAISLTPSSAAYQNTYYVMPYFDAATTTAIVWTIFYDAILLLLLLVAYLLQRNRLKNGVRRGLVALFWICHFAVVLQILLPGIFAMMLSSVQYADDPGMFRSINLMHQGLAVIATVTYLGMLALLLAPVLPRFRRGA